MVREQRLIRRFTRHSAVAVALTTFATMVGCGGSSGGSGASPTADTLPPTITLNGDAQIVLPFAAAYREQGASAQDAVDGSVSVTVSGEVDTLNTGVYTITYSAQDSSGNRAAATRTIEVLERQVELIVSTVGSATYSLASGQDIDCSARVGECKATLPAGSTVTIAASPDANYRFVRWQNCESAIGNECTVVLDDNRTVLSTVVSTAPIVFQPGVVELTAAQIAGLVDYVPTGSFLEFAPGVDLTGIEVGNVLLASRPAPDLVVFARRVTTIDNTSTGATLVQTETPTIPEIIRSGTIVATSGDFTASASASATTGDVPPQLSDVPPIAGDSHQNHIEISLLGSSELVLIDDGTVRVAAFGRVSMAPNFEFVYTLEDDGGFFPRPAEWRFYAETDFFASIGTSISGPVGAALNRTRTFELPPTIRFPATSPVPIVFEVGPVIDIGVNFGVSVEPGLEAYVDRVVTGAQWNRGLGIRPLFDPGEGGIEPSGIDSISGDLSFSVAPGLRSTASVLGVAGPFIEAGAVARATASFRPFDDCEIFLSRYAALRWSAGGSLDVLLYEWDFAIVESEIALRLSLPDIPLACSNRPIDSGDTSPPSRVESIEVVAADVPGQLSISWAEAIDESAVANYQVWRLSASDATSTPVLVLETAATSTNDIGLEGAAEYCYFITAADVFGNTSEVAANLDFVCATTVPDESAFVLVSPTLAPAVPQSNTSIRLTWTSSGDPNFVSGYIVFDLTDTSIPRVLATTEALATVIDDLIPDRTYCYAVASRDVRGQTSSLSNVECARVGQGLPGAGLQGWIALADGDPGVPGDGILIESQNVTCSPDCWTVTTLNEEPDYILANGAEGFTVSSYFVDSSRPNRVSNFIPEFQFINYSGSCGFFLGTFNPRILAAPLVSGVGGTTVVISRDYANQVAADLVEQRPSCAGASADNLFISRIRGDGTRQFRADGVYVSIDSDPFIPKTSGAWVSVAEGEIGLPGDGLSSVGELIEGKSQFTIGEEVVLNDSVGLTLSLYSDNIEVFDVAETTVVFGYTGFPTSCRIESSPLGLFEARTLRGVSARFRSFGRSLLDLDTALFSLTGPGECNGITVDDIYIAALRVGGVELPLDGAFVGIGEDISPFFFDLP